jgi:hypothetical protein
MEDLSCQSVRSALWDHTAGRLAEAESQRIAGHLRKCRACERYRIDVHSIETGLKHLPVFRPPSILSVRLKVAASRDRSKRLRHLDFEARWKEFRERAALTFNNLLKPIAVPATGGILASMLCFGMIVNDLHLDPDHGSDMPIGLYKTAIIDDLSPFSFPGKDLLVQLTIDENGNVTDVEKIPSGKTSPDELREIGNLVLYSTFKPAWASGQPVSSKILLLIQHSTIRG